MLTQISNSANLAEFRSSTPRILYGEMLADVKAVQASIETHGLLNPLVVTRSGDHLMVIDGRKRLAALRRMQFEGRLPRSLVRVPYVVYKTHKDEGMDNPMALLSNAEQYEAVKRLRKAGYKQGAIAEKLHCSVNHVISLLKVDRLSENLRRAFLRDALTLSQVQAFATIDNPDAQDSLLIKLGPFAKETEILQSIARGETILSIDEDNVIILPSRPERTFAMDNAA